MQCTMHGYRETDVSTDSTVPVRQVERSDLWEFGTEIFTGAGENGWESGH